MSKKIIVVMPWVVKLHVVLSFISVTLYMVKSIMQLLDLNE